jgi:hypothetical protein
MHLLLDHKGRQWRVSICIILISILQSICRNNHGDIGQYSSEQVLPSRICESRSLITTYKIAGYEKALKARILRTVYIVCFLILVISTTGHHDSKSLRQLISSK